MLVPWLVETMRLGTSLRPSRNGEKSNGKAAGMGSVIEFWSLVAASVPKSVAVLIAIIEQVVVRRW
ncbi:MAG TPA: hypothetical protein DES72_04765 [Gammaproteobacteria bacterium]|nr:hypothetical protein [Gammaproteobacteria bacterium]